MVGCGSCEHVVTALESTSEPGIGQLNEGSLHAALKHHYADAGDTFEVTFGRFVVDLVKGPGTTNELLVEIQTGSFGAMGNKLDHLLGEHRLLLVHPIAVRTRLERRAADEKVSARRSPKRGSIYSLFDELVSIPTLLDHPNLSLEVVLFDEIRKQVHDPSLRRRRGGYRTVDRQIDEIIDHQRFDSVLDLRRLLPSTLPDVFTTADIADQAGCGRDAAQKLAFCFQAAHLIDRIDRTKAGYRYRISS
jgi:hypothetical protein